ncbi:MAG: M17 family peptidase N-terminal domain-containing protein [Armatimonadota bacterium]
MHIQTINQSIVEFPCSALVVNLFEGVQLPGGATGAVDQALGGLLTQLIAQEQFEGKLGQTLIVHTQGKIPTQKVIVVGLGKADKLDFERIRRASAASPGTCRCAAADR